MIVEARHGIAERCAVKTCTSCGALDTSYFTASLAGESGQDVTRCGIHHCSPFTTHALAYRRNAVERDTPVAQEISAKAGRFHDAELIYRNILASNPGHAEAWHLLGMIAQEAGHAQKAIEYIERALTLEPGRPAFLNNLGKIYKTQAFALAASGPYAEAEGLLHAIWGSTDHANVYGNLADLFGQRDQFDETEWALTQAIRLESDRGGVASAARFSAASARPAAGGGGQFAQRRSFSAGPRRDIMHHRGAFRAWGSRKPPWRRCAGPSPLVADNPALLNDLGIAFKQLGYPEESHACFYQSLESQPDFAQHGQSGFLPCRGGPHRGGAATLYQRSLKSQPDAMTALALGTLLPVVYESMDHLKESQHLEANLHQMEANGVRLDPTQQFMPTLFYLAYQGLNDRDLAAA